MAYRIYVSDDRKYIVLEVTGEITRQQHFAHVLEAHEQGRQLGIRRFLVDAIHARNVDSVTENFQFAYEDMRTTPEIDHGAKVAAVAAPGDHSHDFIEVVLSNSGNSAKFFRDRNEAIRFLTTD